MHLQEPIISSRNSLNTIPVIMPIAHVRSLFGGLIQIMTDMWFYCDEVQVIDYALAGCKIIPNLSGCLSSFLLLSQPYPS